MRSDMPSRLSRQLLLPRSDSGLFRFAAVFVFGLAYLALTICPAFGESSPQPLVVSDYTSAYRIAEEKHGFLLVAFVTTGQEDRAKMTLADLDQVPQLHETVVSVIVPIGGSVELRGRKTVLSDHPAFAGLNRQTGIAVVNLAVSKDDPEYGRVVWTFPVKEDDWAAHREVIRASLIELVVSYHGSGQPTDAMAVLPESTPQNTQESNEVVAATFLSPELSSIWMTDYKKAVEKAKSDKKMLLVYVRPQQPDSLVSQFERKTLLDPQVMKELFRFVCVRVPETYVVEENGAKTKILDHPSLAEMEHRPGLFIVDYASTEADYYGQVVSQFPFLNGKPYSVEQMGIILTLPPGTLTQRTMVYAVRVHPERPRSILGRPDSFLFKEAEKHSAYQARIRLLGHHFWETRFHRIIQTLRNESTASEVCAQSWPGQGLLEAALECVRCWRLSSGHWRAVSSYQDAYGYDIKKGSDGIWYATGVFARRR